MNKVTGLLLAALVSSAAYGEETRRYLIETRAELPRHGLPERMAARNQDSISIPAAQIHMTAPRLNIVIADLTEAQAARLSRSRGVRWIEPDQEMRAFSTRATVTASSAVPGQLTPYGITLVNAEAAWERTRGEGVKIAVADTGIDHQHPDLMHAYRGGFDFVNNDDDPMDDHGHGTHVAGTIAAADNEIGVIGVAPMVDLYGLKVLNSEGSGVVSFLVKAIDWAIENEMHVINLSLGFEKKSPLLESAFAKAAAHGLISVAASGNSFDENPVLGVSYPAAFGSVLSVGAIDSMRKVATFSQRGSELKVVAPGVSVRSAVPLGSSSFGIIEGVDVQISGSAMSGSPKPDSTLGELVFANLGKAPSDFQGVRGRIALIERGEITFAEKVTRAREAGAKAVVIYNHLDEGVINGTLTGSEEWTGPFIPTIGISKEDGQALKKKLGTEVHLRFNLYDYEDLHGTSMATPHVAGVAALVKSLNPDATASQIKQMIMSSSIDLGDAGWDTTHGFGLVDADAATRNSPPSLRRRGVRH